MQAPGAGYVVPAAYAAIVAAKLNQHGISYQLIKSPQAQASLETFRADKVTFTAAPFESLPTAIGRVPKFP